MKPLFFGIGFYYGSTCGISPVRQVHPPSGREPESRQTRASNGVRLFQGWRQKPENRDKNERLKAGLAEAMPLSKLKIKHMLVGSPSRTRTRLNLGFG